MRKEGTLEYGGKEYKIIAGSGSENLVLGESGKVIDTGGLTKLDMENLPSESLSEHIQNMADAVSRLEALSETV